MRRLPFLAVLGCLAGWLPPSTSAAQAVYTLPGAGGRHVRVDRGAVTTGIRREAVCFGEANRVRSSDPQELVSGSWVYIPVRCFLHGAAGRHPGVDRA